MNTDDPTFGRRFHGPPGGTVDERPIAQRLRGILGLQVGDGTAQMPGRYPGPELAAQHAHPGVITS